MYVYTKDLFETKLKNYGHFRTILAQLFDIKHLFSIFYSFQKDILVAHLCWEYCHRWDKDKSRLQLLQDSYDCLNSIECLELAHRLTRLLWNVLLNKAVKEAINLTEIRSLTRCERELGFSEENLPTFLQTVCQVLDLHQKTVMETDEIR